MIIRDDTNVNSLGNGSLEQDMLENTYEFDIERRLEPNVQKGESTISSQTPFFSHFGQGNFKRNVFYRCIKNFFLLTIVRSTRLFPG